MAKRRPPKSPRTPEAAEAHRRRRRERERELRALRAPAVRPGSPGDTLPGPRLTRLEQQALRHDTLHARVTARRAEVELRAARADQHRSDVARSEAVIALARLHERYAAALDRLIAADARIAALEAQNASLRARLGREAPHG